MRFSDAFKENYWTVSNFLSISRVFLLPIYIYLGRYYRADPGGSYFSILLLLLFLAVLSDFLDGWLARALNQVTMVGRYLDPICDKIVTLIGMLDSSLHYGFPWIVFGFCVFREILGVWMGTFLYFKRDVQGRPNIWGKVGVTLVALAILWYLCVPWLTLNGYSGIIVEAWLGAAAVFAVFFIGMVAYAHTYWDIILHGGGKRNSA